MQLADLRTVKIPFTLYDLFGYLLPGIFFFALFPITYDMGTVFDLISKLASNRPLAQNLGDSFFLLKIVGVIKASPWLISVYFLLIAYLLGHIVAALSGFVLERLGVAKFLKYPACNMFNLRTHEGLVEKKVFAILKKIPRWDTVKSFFFKNYRRPYSEDFVATFTAAFERVFGLKAQNESDIFWLSFAFISQNCPATFQRASHFLNLYGFARNLSMMFFTFLATIFVLELGRGFTINVWVFLAYGLIGSGFFWQYLKFFRRLNDEVYRGFLSFVAAPTVAAGPGLSERGLAP